MRWLRSRLGHRGAALLFFAFLDFVYCGSLFLPTRAARDGELYRFLSAIVPLWGWAILWGAVGAVCLIYAFRRRDQPGFSAAMGLKVLWASVCIGGQISGDLERGYVAAAVWGALAALVGLLSTWPEPSEGPWTRPSR